ncbi:MAG: hypothetical protein JNL49_11070 [Bacteroidia bacterium]|nr:hypothetical protein [Bacteroidia bacterium]
MITPSISANSIYCESGHLSYAPTCKTENDLLSYITWDISIEAEAIKSNPLASISIIAGLNMLTDATNGTAPKIDNLGDLGMWAGSNLLSGMEVTGVTQLGAISLSSWKWFQSYSSKGWFYRPTGSISGGVTGLEVEITSSKVLTTSLAKPGSALAGGRTLSWGRTAKSHLIRHADALGFGQYSPQQLQKMLPQLKGSADELYNNINPGLTRIGRWGGQTDDVLMHITNNGKMLVTKQNGEFITVINKTSNQWYKLASPFK